MVAGPEEETQSEETSVSKADLIAAGEEVLEKLDFSDEKKGKLRDSLARQTEYLLYSNGARFITLQETDFFIQVMLKLNIRPVLLIDLNKEDDPERILSVLRHQVGAAEIMENELPPIVFVKGFKEDRLNKKVDPNWMLDRILKCESKRNNWMVFLEGEYRFAYNRSSPLSKDAGSSELFRSELKARRAEMRAARSV